jgi:hypothetical protein
MLETVLGGNAESVRRDAAVLQLSASSAPASSAGKRTGVPYTLYNLRRKKPRIAVDDAQYRLRISIYDSFGEDAFRVELRRI